MAQLAVSVASDTRGLRFESGHWQNLIMNIFTDNYWRDEKKEKRGPELVYDLFN